MEFVIRGRVLPAARGHRVQRRIVGAKLLRHGGADRHRSRPDAHADLIVVDGDPYADVSLLAKDGAHMPAIMKGGAFCKNVLR